MWAILKFDKNKLEFLKKEIKKKIGSESSFYNPKFFIQRYNKNKLVNKELSLLGDYIFCYHKKFNDYQTINKLKFTKGLKYFLNGFINSQSDIEKFIKKCKESENKNGYLTQNFFKIIKNTQYKFSSGPLSQMIFEVVNLQENKINILLGNIKTTIKRDEHLFTPL